MELVDHNHRFNVMYLEEILQEYKHGFYRGNSPFFCIQSIVSKYLSLLDGISKSIQYEVMDVVTASVSEAVNWK